jgi:hypothetical protein
MKQLKVTVTLVLVLGGFGCLVAGFFLMLTRPQALTAIGAVAFVAGLMVLFHEEGWL